MSKPEQPIFKQFKREADSKALGRVGVALAHDVRGTARQSFAFLEFATNKASFEDSARVEEAKLNARSASSQVSVQVASLVEYIRLGDKCTPELGLSLEMSFVNALTKARFALPGSSPTLDIDNDCLFWGDRRLIERMAYELISNSAQWSQRSDVTISITAETKNDRLYLRVRDDGSGQDSSYNPVLGDLFYSTANQNGPERGLGLAMCRRIVELHGGEFNVTCKGLSEGFEVEFDLPADLRS